MKTKLSDFLTDIRDSEEKRVLVTEKQLRKYAQQCIRWEIIAKQNSKTIQDNRQTILRQKKIIETLTIKNDMLKISNDHEVIDLYT